MIKDFISENWWKITQNFSRQFLGQVLNVANIYSLRNWWNWWNFGKLLKFARQFLGSVLNVAYLLLGKVICLWHIINIPPKTTTCDKTKDSLRLKVNFKKNIQIVAQNTFAPDRAAGIVKSRQQVAIFLLTWHQLKKTCNLPSSIDIVRFCFLSESYNKFRLNSLHLIHWFSIIQYIQEKIFCKSNDGDASK